ncbi:MAG: hypothetical protein Q8N94_01700 [Methanoregula sp.]|nr:hypothetical protein [Methanoregula sp.]
MSIDFLVGFTIFMITFIWVATLIPGLFIGLQSHTIDYDAVAYRAGVILVEDPGAVGPLVTGNQPWEIQNDKRDVARFGLAVSKETPRILDENKVNRFFCLTAFSYPEDYQKRVIFGNYPYRFNISLRAVGEDTPRSVGDVVPDNYPYGYIRRDVKIKGSSNTTIGETMINAHGYKSTENVTLNEFRIVINSSYLLTGKVGEIVNPNRDAAYRINPNWDRIIINITDLDKTRNTDAHPEPYSVNLSKVKFYQTYTGDSNLYAFSPVAAFENYTYVNWSATAVKPPVDLGTDSNLSMIFEPGFFSSTDKYGAIYINLTFELDPKQQFLNNTHTRPFDYNYNPVNVTQPALKDAVMEVAVW